MNEPQNVGHISENITEEDVTDALVRMTSCGFKFPRQSAFTEMTIKIILSRYEQRLRKEGKL